MICIKLNKLKIKNTIVCEVIFYFSSDTLESINSIKEHYVLPYSIQLKLDSTRMIAAHLFDGLVLGIPSHSHLHS